MSITEFPTSSQKSESVSEEDVALLGLLDMSVYL